MIHEVIVTTISKTQKVHIAPMGIRLVEEQIIISPFKPSQTLENILNKLDTKLDNNYSSIKQPIYSFNKEILNNFENNKFAKIFKVFNIKEIEIIDNPYNIFNKFKLYIFYGITYVVLLLIIIILFYSYKLNKTKFIN